MIAIFAVGKGKALSAIVIWFAAIFALYTAFYAGSVIFGVDWRFMIGLMAPFAILVGAAISGLSLLAESLISKLRKEHNHHHTVLSKYTGVAVAIILGISLFYILYLNAGTVFVNPASIQQAGDARFYENFVYNSSRLIPANCLVYSYDPTLFNINNRSGSQMSNIYDQASSTRQRNSSPVQCLTKVTGATPPGNICTQAEHTYNLTPIATATYTNGFTYGFYKIS